MRSQFLEPKPERKLPPIQGTATVNSEIAALREVAAKNPNTPPSEPKPDGKPEAEEKETVKSEVLSITAEQLNAIVAAKVEEAAEKATAKLEAKLALATTEAEEQRKARENIERVLSVTGYANPSASDQWANINTQFPPSREATGILKEWEQIIGSAAKVDDYQEENTGYIFTRRDNTESDRYFAANRAKLRLEIEKLAKSAGFLRGKIDKAAATVKSDVAPLLLDYLSATVRQTHTAQFIFWQFVYGQLELGKGPGDVIQVMRANNIVGSTTLTDYDLSGNGTFVALDANRQNQAIGKVSMTLGERGMGKAGVAANYLVGIPEFLKAYTMYSLEQIVAQKIGLNYQTYLDLAIRTRYASTTRKVYNVSGNVALLPASIVTGSDGTMSEGFLIFLGAYMDSLLIPRKSNGNFTIVLNTTSAARLQASMKASNISFRMEDRAALADAFRFGSDISNPMISGYVGTVGQFDVFQSNAFGVGAAGTEGVRTEVTGPGTLLNRSSYAFGDMAVARAVGMEMQIFQSEITDSGRLQSYGWRSHETTGDLDVDPSNGGDANQQLRVIDVRTLDTPV